MVEVVPESAAPPQMICPNLQTSLVATIQLSNGTSGVAVAPDGRYIYVVIVFSNAVAVIDTTTNNVVTTIRVGPSPVAVAATARNVYVVNRDSNRVSVIDVSQNPCRASPVR
jgi:YVTN family beta-propeller protein